MHAVTSSFPEPTRIRERRGVTLRIFQDEILAAAEPVLIRDAVHDWPAVRAGCESPASLTNYLRARDAGASADTMIGPPEIRGYFFYNDDLTALNFRRGPAPVAASLTRLLALLDDPAPPAFYVGAV